jgi:YHS domain-containing protein
MEVDPENAEASSFYMGETYYFTNITCKALFDRNPEKFLEPPATAKEKAPACRKQKKGVETVPRGRLMVVGPGR